MSKADRYREMVPEMQARDLLDALRRSVLANSYGSHDEQISIIEAELLARMNENG